MIPDSLNLDSDRFESVWQLHPPEFHTINLFGPKKTPRWQQAYGVDYYYRGQINRACRIRDDLVPYLEWAKQTIDARLNGLLLNWYEGSAHYIGPHHDDTHNMIDGAPIVTVSFGEDRNFVLTNPKLKQTHEFRAPHGTVFIISCDLNKAWKHAVPRSNRYTGRRISITIRGLFSL
jgi:alkylated DNA repair dioxygenase AlkB